MYIVYIAGRPPTTTIHLGSPELVCLRKRMPYEVSNSGQDKHLGGREMVCFKSEYVFGTGCLEASCQFFDPVKKMLYTTKMSIVRGDITGISVKAKPLVLKRSTTRKQKRNLQFFGYRWINNKLMRSHRNLLTSDTSQYVLWDRRIQPFFFVKFCNVFTASHASSNTSRFVSACLFNSFSYIWLRRRLCWAEQALKSNL